MKSSYPKVPETDWALLSDLLIRQPVRFMMSPPKIVLICVGTDGQAGAAEKSCFAMKVAYTAKDNSPLRAFKRTPCIKFQDCISR